MGWWSLQVIQFTIYCKYTLNYILLYIFIFSNYTKSYPHMIHINQIEYLIRLIFYFVISWNSLKVMSMWWTFWLPQICFINSMRYLKSIYLYKYYWTSMRCLWTCLSDQLRWTQQTRFSSKPWINDVCCTTGLHQIIWIFYTIISAVMKHWHFCFSCSRHH